MRLWKVVVVAGMVFSFLSSGGIARANEEDWGGRTPMAEGKAKRKGAERGKKKGKAKGLKKAKAKKGKKAGAQAKSKKKGKAKANGKRNRARAQTHRPEAAADEAYGSGLSDMSNEKKDDLPPPMNTEPAEE